MITCNGDWVSYLLVLMPMKDSNDDGRWYKITTIIIESENYIDLSRSKLFHWCSVDVGVEWVLLEFCLFGQLNAIHTNVLNRVASAEWDLFITNQIHSLPVSLVLLNPRFNPDITEPPISTIPLPALTTASAPCFT